jgi:predicted metal-dependent hydrolase
MIQMPMTLIDYVVAHEVAHLREMNHSKRFWAVVGSLVPDYTARRHAIRREGHRYLVV